MRQMIISNTEAGRRAALARLLPFQREDFRQLFTIMAGLPVTVRLLDPPLHEFLPHGDAEMQEVARRARRRRGLLSGGEAPSWRKRTRCWVIAAAGWAVTYPEIYEMQARAIFEGAIRSARKPATRRIRKS